MSTEDPLTTDDPQVTEPTVVPRSNTVNWVTVLLGVAMMATMTAMDPEYAWLVVYTAPTFLFILVASFPGFLGTLVGGAPNPHLGAHPERPQAGDFTPK